MPQDVQNKAVVNVYAEENALRKRHDEKESAEREEENQEIGDAGTQYGHFLISS